MNPLSKACRRRLLELTGLKRLTARERRLIVGHAELEYSYRQLALIEDLSPDAARMALRRAIIV